MKKKSLDKKKRKVVRARDWESAAKHDFAFTHDRLRHRRATLKLRQQPEELSPLPQEFEPNGIVISHSKKWAFVELDGEEQLCLIDERLQEKECTLLAPGDAVLVEFEEEDAFVRGVAPRRTRISRPGIPGARLKEQVFAANIDVLVVVVAAAQPPFRVGLVDRYLIAAAQGGVDSLLCINKIDLVDEEPDALELYRALGLTVLCTSCETGQGLEALRQALAGKTALLSGHSGVGKSSLLNRLDPDLQVDTQEVSEATHKGRHTTTASRLYTLEGGLRIIDTPGIRALGLGDITPAEVTLFFPELARYAQECKFRNCTHIHEPQCAVRAAMEAGQLSAIRYESYRRIRASLESATGHTPGRVKPTQ